MPFPPLTRRALLGSLAGLGLAPSLSLAQNRSTESVLTWTARPFKTPLRPEAPEPTELWGFEGRLQGEALRLKVGEELRLTLVNETPKPLSLHVQGLRGPNSQDGAGGLTEEPLPPGGKREIRLAPAEPGTYLIRPCVIGGTAEPLERGLSALLVVEEPQPPPVDHDIALLIDDWRLEENGTLAPFAEPARTGPGRLGNWISVNGRAAPQRLETAPGARVRLRLANAANARALRLRFDGLRPHVLAVDSQPTDTFEPLKATLPLAPGARYDLIFDAPETAGETGALVTLLGSGAPLFEIATRGERHAARPAIAGLGPNPRLPQTIRLQDARRAEVTVSGEGPFLFDKAAGDPRKPLLQVKRGTPVVLAVNNRTALPQPFHLHGHSFRLLHAFDDGWDPYFLDTFQAPENRISRIAFVADNPGKWLFASAVAERFDAGLWSFIDVS